MGTVYVNNLTNQRGINSYSDPFNYGSPKDRSVM
jgi:hypothetical protein